MPPPPRRTPRPQGDGPRRSEGADRPRRQGESRPTRQGESRPRPQGDRRAGRPDEEPRRPRVPEPELPGDVDPRELDRDARAELRSLPASLADKIAAHLIVAGRLLDDDPPAAREHAWYARQLAPRLAVTREAAGITAYRAGDYAAALAELRAVRRMNGDPSQLPVMAGIFNQQLVCADGGHAVVHAGAPALGGALDVVDGPGMDDRPRRPRASVKWRAGRDLLQLLS